MKLNRRVECVDLRRYTGPFRIICSYGAEYVIASQRSGGSRAVAAARSSSDMPNYMKLLLVICNGDKLLLPVQSANHVPVLVHEIYIPDDAP